MSLPLKRTMTLLGNHLTVTWDSNRTKIFTVDPVRAQQYLDGLLLVQEAFPELSPSGREFILTGLTDEEFDEITKEPNDTTVFTFDSSDFDDMLDELICQYVDESAFTTEADKRAADFRTAYDDYYNTTPDNHNQLIQRITNLRAEFSIRLCLLLEELNK